MTSSNLDDLTTSFETASASINGVSFKGKSLKLDTQEDAKSVVESIERCKTLEFLNLEGNTLGVQASQAIAKSLETHPEFKRALWKDMFTGRMKTEIPRALEYLGSSLVTAGARLIELDLSDNAFGPIGVEGLASLLRSSSCFGLEELRLNNNGLGITGGKLLATALLDCYNSSKNEGKPLALKVFVAGRNRLENDGAIALAEVFKAIGTLEEIVMPQNGIYHAGISALSDAFTYNKNLTLLNLNDNTVGYEGVKAFVKALPTLQNLKSINFGDCLLKTKGAMMLAKGLQEGHNKLEEVILGYNEIKKEGGLALALALYDKTNLKTLMLNGNQFGNSGRKELELKMKEIGKYVALSDLDENESEASESEEDKIENENAEDVSQVDTEKQLIQKITAISIGDSKEVDINTFMKNPTAENFVNLGINRTEIILAEVERDGDAYLETITPILMKISSLCKNNKEEIAKASLECTVKLYKRLFEWAVQKDQLSLVNNFLLVHLGLIKSEDKKFKVTWNLEGCLFAIETVLKGEFVPEITRLIFKTFLERKVQE
ncbi:ran GTPase-activating protein 1 [Agrilus planipennis]|uniref:Ran GTPase-activating protein 1 n=1 Tax=Agrilus planipennis TaxID=224129 RepID=A0A7F5RC99_AGRPL|nr:ran GTPase-activating protein 1 [Agrilus planipennis]